MSKAKELSRKLEEAGKEKKGDKATQNHLAGLRIYTENQFDTMIGATSYYSASGAERILQDAKQKIYKILQDTEKKISKERYVTPER